MESPENTPETPPNSGYDMVKKTRREDEVTRDMVASMRRLRIQENLLETAARSSIEDQDLKVLLHAVAAKRNKEFMEIKNTFHVLKSLLDRFKYNVSSPECLRKMEIEEYKKMVLELDNKIISFKRFLAKELNVLRAAENALTAEIKEAECELINVNAKLVAKPYNDIVPSSVKALRNTPSPCPEVQRFQEFLCSRGGHRGGWGEQEHALFQSCRRHCAGAGKQADGVWLDSLVNSLVEKIPGLAAGEVLKHEIWYSEYVRLKAEQLTALQRWKGRRLLAREEFRRFELHLPEYPKDTKNVKSAKPRTTHQRASSEETKTNVGEIVESQEYNKANPTNKRATESKQQSNSTPAKYKCERICHQTKTSKVQTDNVRAIRTNLQDNEEFNQNEGVQIKNVDSYLKPTRAWSSKIEKEDNGLDAKDFRLHIPMGNAPKLGISNWRRCLVEQLS